ncbi:hypothetical protein ACFXCR_01740 [Streptomyces sp. NPDC059431]|uniref:hypothetical protein n=1 Tax=Streptomyces sp. NPDC059431 TaxID=3346828 RepID=UPI003696FC6E
MCVQGAAAAVAAGRDMLPVVGAGVPLDGVAAPPQVPSDDSEAHPLFQQSVDQRMMGLEPCGKSAVAACAVGATAGEAAPTRSS